ncbi:MAG: serine/threonine-protein kinase [Bacteroidota bacterium]
MTPPTDPTRWSEVKRLFKAALDLPRSDRAEFLDGVCRTPDGEADDELYRAVRVLLDADEEAETEADSGFLGTPALSLRSLLDGLGVEIVGGEPGGSVRVGPYQLLRLLGRGGMGEVYLAERADGLFERTVALKRVRADLAPSVAARFSAERQILADLVHPGIARLYGAGTDDDNRPWLAMEPVDGVPITTYAQARDLPRRKRVALMLQVCAAVQHAHQRLVVHRDLKPSNVLVEDGGAENLGHASGSLPSVKLLDFGIAQILGDDGNNLLTRAHASPEQLRGEPATTASDVYGLGGLLVETLTGERAPGPGQAPGLGDDLGAIARKALADVPADRYVSAEALADDLRRWLDDRPVSAHPHTLGYRARRFLARNRVPATIAGVALLLLTLASSLATVRVMEERDRAQQAADDAEAVVDTQNQLLRVLEPSFVAEIDTARGVAAAPTVAAVMNQTLGTVEEAYADNPAVLARSYVTLGASFFERGEPRRADSLFREALALRRPLNREADPVLREALIGRGLVARDLGTRAEARRFFREVLAMEREHPTLAEDSSSELFLASVTDDDTARERELLRVLAQRRQQSDDVALAQAHNALGTHYSNTQDYRSAYAEFVATERILRRTLGEYHPHTLTLRANLSYASAQMGDHDGAERHAQIALDGARRGSLGPMRVANYTQALGQAHFYQQRYAESERHLRDALAIYDRETGPTSVQALGIVSSLVVVTAEQSDYTSALAFARRVEASERAAGTIRQSTGIYARAQVAALRYASGDREAAGADLVALADEIRATTDTPVYRATVLNQAGIVLTDSGDPEAALPLLRESVRLQREARADDSFNVRHARFSLGAALVALGRLDEARPHLEAARGHGLHRAYPVAVPDLDAEIDRLLGGS